MEAIAERELSVVLSSHLMADLERVADYLIVLVGSQVRVAGPVDELLATHHLLTGPRRDLATLPAGQRVISASHTDRQATLLIRTSEPVLDPAWTVSEVTLEDLVHAAGSRRRQAPRPSGGAEMTWLTWRQFRPQTVTSIAALAAFAIMLGATGPHLASMYAGSGVASCQRNGTCDHLAGTFLSALSGGYTVVFMLGVAVIILAPVVIGVFWGAPLIAREFETGTYRLAWTQSTTRARWLASKLAVPGLAAMAVTAGFSLMYGWWAAPIGQAARVTGDSSFPLGMSPFSLLAFDAHGVVPLGYAAFGFALGVAMGVLIRRSLPAMAVTLAIFAAVQVIVPLALRPSLFPPAHTTQSLAANFSGGMGVAGSSFTLAIDCLNNQPAPGSCQAMLSTPSGSRSASSRPPAWDPAGRLGTRCRAWPATASRSPSATSPPAVTGPSSGPRPGSTSHSRRYWPGSATGVRAAAWPDGLTLPDARRLSVGSDGMVM